MRAASPAPNLSGMTKDELLDYAREEGITGVNGSMRKAAIIQAIEEAM